MHYVESGTGDPVLFIHGNPTWSYLWRNVLPYAARHGRAMAVDLVGMGRSDKPALDYRFADHLRYVQAFIETLDLTDITLVLHDWGGGLGLAFARRHPERVRAVALMEAVIRPSRWADVSLPEKLLFRLMRTQRIGDLMNKRGAFFIERVVPMMTERTLPPEVRAAYREPFPTLASRQPVAQWPREIPFDGEPADVHAEIEANERWLAATPVPKLLLHADPGLILQTDTVARLEEQLSELTSVSVGRGKHYLQEDHPHEIGRALDAWLAQMEARSE